MGLIDVKKELQKLDKGEIIDLVSELYKKNKSPKEFLDFWANPNENELFTKYRDKVFRAFYAVKGYDYSLKNGKQAISDFKKFSPSADLIADLMLFYVETGVIFTNDFGDVDEPFYSSMETTYESALKLMKKEDLLDKFAVRVKKIVDDSDGTGWGFHDTLGDIYCDFYEEGET
jgi:Family of unknown function (DUF6155)